MLNLFYSTKKKNFDRKIESIYNELSDIKKYIKNVSEKPNREKRNDPIEIISNKPESDEENKFMNIPPSNISFGSLNKDISNQHAKEQINPSLNVH